MKLNKGIIFTNNNCIGCNRCISGCPSLGANISITRDGQNHIYVDDDKCLHCGHCLDTCRHNAREFRDDTDLFLQDLNKGTPISLLVAPSFFVIYEKRAFQILGYLKSLGVHLIYDVSYGADIATWAYLSYIEKHNFKGAIAPPCSAIVNYIEKYSRLLFDRLIPVHSPLLCLATYVKKYLGNTDRLAFLSPCIAKKDEISDPKNQDIVHYNVTFLHLLSYLEDVDLSGYSTQLELSDSGLGRVYPAPGGLSENIRLFISPEHTIREVHGELNVYDYFDKLEQRILFGKELPFMIDCLNCSQGCLAGTGTPLSCTFDDDILFHMQTRRTPNPLITEEENPYLASLSTQERRKRLNERFSHLNPDDFTRLYDDKKFQNERHRNEYVRNYADKLDAIFLAMHKITPESRKIDCHSCGYSSCLEMATAISKGYNHIENCVHYMKDENLRIATIEARTGIPNFNAFLNFADKLILSGRISQYTSIFFNIRNFKSINQKYGFKRGDAALKEYASRVAGLAFEDELVALIGGNDFVGIFRSEHLEAVLKALDSVPLYTPSEDEVIPVSARISVYSPDGTDTSPQMLVEKLSMTYSAMNHNKKQTILYYHNGLREKALQEDMMIQAIEPAIENQEFQVYYQPKVDIRTRKLVGAEALIRWYRCGTVIPPMEFIPLCETVGLVQKLDFYVLNAVCRDITEWIAKGIRVVPISVNFSKQHFVDPFVADHINEVADKWHVPKKYLEIEFTETAYLADSKNVIYSIDRLHEYGISSSMDDFGTGYSSLSMLQNMSFNTLKLDKSFLNEGNFGDHRSRAVIENIIRMAKQLNMFIVSEGIETDRELAYMKEMNCDFAQGYLFDKPLTKQEFERRLLRILYPE